MADNRFFNESSDQSLVKMTIVSKYFWAWAKVIIPTVKQHGSRIAYLDLFAGPGRYKDGTKSTPLLVLEHAIADPDMSQMLVTMFNDKDEENVQSLKSAISALPNVNNLKHAPVILHQEVGSEMVKMFEQMKVIPTLFFVDPWGYKGLSLQLVNAVLKDWGCDCIFFFNYNRINMGLGNPSVQEHMNALFGETRANELRPKLDSLGPNERELTIVEELCQALGASRGRFVLPFRFRNPCGTRTSHHLIFVSKHFRGYEIMKGIMAKESSVHEQGVPTFEYNPADRRYPTLFELFRPLDDLEDLLLAEFSGRTMKMGDIYEKHNVGRRYIKKNYKDVLAKLEQEGRIVANPPASSRRCRGGIATFADHVCVTFTPQGSA